MPINEVERAETARVKRRVFDMRQSLIPYRVIAEELKLSVSAVRGYYAEMRAALLPTEAVEEIRDRDIEGYDQSERNLRTAIDILTKQIEQRLRDEPQANVASELKLLADLEGKITDIRK